MVCCSFISCGAVQWLGNLTYASFLLYFPLPLLLVLFLGGALLGLFVSLSRLLVALAYRWLEYPAQQFLRDRVRPVAVAAMRMM